VAHCRPGRVARHVCSWREPTQHPSPYDGRSPETCLGSVPGARSHSRRAFVQRQGLRDDGTLGKPVDRGPPGARREGSGCVLAAMGQRGRANPQIAPWPPLPDFCERPHWPAPPGIVHTGRSDRRRASGPRGRVSGPFQDLRAAVGAVAGVTGTRANNSLFSLSCLCTAHHRPRT
jgi:hypothetical protein